MKSVSFFLITFLLLFSSCKKSSHNNIDLDSLPGTWELRKITGGFTKDYPEGNGNYFKFTENEYELYAGDTLYKKGTYSIVTEKIAVGSECGPSIQDVPKSDHQRIIYDGKVDSTKEALEISNGLLKLTSGCFALDYGVEKRFVKIK